MQDVLMNEVELTMSPYGNFLGIRIVEAAAGKSVCHLELKGHHMNTGGRVHGGVLTSLADTAAGIADLSISFIRRPLGKIIEAHAEVIHAGKRLFRTEISVLSDGKLIAKTNATFMLVDRPKG
jgi:acyl-CoA thioesterase